MRMSTQIKELVAEKKILEEKVVALHATVKSADAMVELAVTSAVMKEKAARLSRRPGRGQEQTVNNA